MNCHYCDRPLDHDSPYLPIYHKQGVSDGLHESCHCRYQQDQEELQFVELMYAQEPQFYESYPD